MTARYLTYPITVSGPYGQYTIEAIVDAGPCPASPTTVVDLAVAPPVIVRRGLGDPARLGLAADDGEAVEVN